MKHIIYSLFTLFIVSCSSQQITTQKPIRVINGSQDSEKSSLIPYEVFENDKLGIRQYTLKNGLTVFTSVNKEEPRIQTYITTKAGYVNDPKHATGLAHYLEHMLFKGTDKIGTVNYKKEAVELNKIKQLFEKYKATKDELERDAIYKQIDSISFIAAKYACPNELDQLLTIIGAENVNAFTAKENTTYQADIPANQLENWIHIESERFKKPVLRLFHTELEAVYEEKNRASDSYSRGAFEVLLANLFTKHNYGQQTGLGTIEHLKSPSMLEIEKFYKTYYRPNNMCIVLSGDFNPDEAVEAINKSYFGDWKGASIPEYNYEAEPKLTEPKKIDYYAPDPEMVMMSYLLPGYNDEHTQTAKMLDMILANSAAGLIDINITKAQKAAYAVSTEYMYKDYGMLLFYATPTQGQKLEELEALLLAQVDSLKEGNFPDWLIDAVVLDVKTSKTKELLGNKNRALDINQAFALNQPIQNRINEFEELKKVTKEQVMEYAKKYLNNNYVIVYKRQKLDALGGLKVDKPEITPLETNNDNRSDFLNNFAKNNKVESLSPEFVDYTAHLDSINFQNGNTLVYLQNKVNDLFTLSFQFPLGTFHDNKIGLASSLMNIAGTTSLSPAQIEQEFYKIGASFNISSNNKKTIVSLSGLAEKLDTALALMNRIIYDLKPSSQQLDALKAKIAKQRENQLNDKNSIFNPGLLYKLKFGEQSPLLDKLTSEEIEALTVDELTGLFKQAVRLQHKVTYYGPAPMVQIKKLLITKHFDGGEYLKGTAPKKYDIQSVAKTKIYAVNFDMQQAEILMLAPDKKFTKKNHLIFKLFNEYYGAGMASVIFQEIREKKALAYTAYAGYSGGKDTINPQYVIGYLGTQADKTVEAIEEMMRLLNTLPLDSIKFEQAKQNFKQGIETNRITRASIFGAYYSDKKLGYEKDSRSYLYEQLDKISLKDVELFFNQHIKGQSYNIGIIGNLKAVNLKALSKFGEIEIVDKESLFVK